MRPKQAGLRNGPVQFYLGPNFSTRTHACRSLIPQDFKISHGPNSHVSFTQLTFWNPTAQKAIENTWCNCVDHPTAYTNSDAPMAACVISYTSQRKETEPNLSALSSRWELLVHATLHPKKRVSSVWLLSRHTLRQLDKEGLDYIPYSLMKINLITTQLCV